MYLSLEEQSTSSMAYVQRFSVSAKLQKFTVGKFFQESYQLIHNVLSSTICAECYLLIHGTENQMQKDIFTFIHIKLITGFICSKHVKK